MYIMSNPRLSNHLAWSLTCLSIYHSSAKHCININETINRITFRKHVYTVFSLVCIGILSCRKNIRFHVFNECIVSDAWFLFMKTGYACLIFFFLIYLFIYFWINFKTTVYKTWSFAKYKNCGGSSIILVFKI